MITYDWLRKAPVESVERLARYLGIGIERRPNESAGQWEHRLSTAVLRRVWGARRRG